ncbi:hypothetical protein SAMN04487936_101534 [Halobacillus dabanensis]|uniref:Sublancin immunity protein SunI-like PH domain-containing protein n=1 Tax=Halobacillus dabanensis TaxID=240302 RepID=A0A1I3Q5H7_HALDA|nr:hypothetical protein [Halobacillus dabanensis]SFJ28677.1 hypothetical protein SAMN04487936_101534 [Halobacillus dabanensis]
MIGVNVKESSENIIVSWQLSKVEIPKNEIIEVIGDDTYGGEEQTAMRIGYPYATTERIVIKTRKQNYILFTNDTSIRNKIERMIS